MFKRPAYISILVGFLSLFCVFMVFFYLKIVFLSGGDDDTPQPPPTPAAQAAAAAAAAKQIIPASAMPFVGLVYSVIAFICAVNMLEGANWARWLYTVSFLLFLICDIMVYSEHFLPYVPALFVRGIVIPFLFLPGANDFFKSAN